MNEKIVKALGSVAAVAAIVMYVSYIPQIIGNLHGNRGDYIQPLAAAINCILWVGYGLLKKERDWPIEMCIRDRYCGISARNAAKCTAWRNLWSFAVRFPIVPAAAA